MDSTLSPLQRAFLDAFFSIETRFFLTVGAALAGSHLGHRTTADLDLFATEDVMEAGDDALRQAALSLGATVENIQTSRTFRRRLVRHGEGSVVVDLVIDATRQGYPEKLRIGKVRVDPAGEIMANKLCALLARAELRDLVDVAELDAAGHAVEHSHDLAHKKDGGLTPGQLAWVLSQITIPDGARIAGRHSAEELRSFLARLQARLARVAFP